jgi:hypothetical protein
MANEIAAVIPAGSGAEGAAVAIGQLDTSTAADEYIVADARSGPPAGSDLYVFDLPDIQVGAAHHPYPNFRGGITVAIGYI